MAKDKKQKQEKTSVFGQLLTNLFVGANLMTLVLLWVCVASIWLDASLHPRLAIVGLAFPILLVLNLLFVPFWLLFKPRMLVVPLLGMGVVGGYILDYHPLNLFGKDKEALRLQKQRNKYYENQLKEKQKAAKEAEKTRKKMEKEQKKEEPPVASARRQRDTKETEKAESEE